MARRTLLQATNYVLRRLRESEVSSVNDRSYSKLICDLVNEALRHCENAHYWSDLYTQKEVQMGTGSGNRIAIIGWSDRYRINQVVDKTSNFNRLTPMSNYDWDVLDTTIQGQPNQYRIVGSTPLGDPILGLAPVVDDTYTISVSGWVGQGTISADNTSIIIPDYPVLLWAYAMAIQERGEDAGVSVSEAQDFAANALYEAIERDSESQEGGQVPYWRIG